MKIHIYIDETVKPDEVPALLRQASILQRLAPSAVGHVLRDLKTREPVGSVRFIK